MATRDYQAIKNLIYNYDFGAAPTDALVPEITEDLITLSCVQYRLNNQSLYKTAASPLWTTANWYDAKASGITDEDRILALDIKRHFSSKLMVLTLKGITLSQWRKDLQKLLNEVAPKTLRFNSNYVGMAYKLPYFYHYDKEIAEIFGGEHRKITGQIAEPRTKASLRFIKSLRNHLKDKDRMIEYWFSDDRDNRVLFKVDRKNSLLPVWDSIIKKEIVVSGYFYYRNRDDLDFYEIKNWEIEI